ncbi:MAG: hypothetical protein PUF51_02135 [Bifidobacteriaceae bacterium]|nr:hypothetical protein [Bifidobacteriaceae bacterium]
MTPRHAFTRRTVRTAKRTAAAFLSVCLLGSVAACAEPLPTVQTRMGQLTSGTTTTETAVTEDQEKAIRSRILDVVNAATTNHDASGLSARVTGPELDVRTSELTVYNATGNTADITELPADASQVNLPITTTWPRAIFTFTTTTSDQQSQRLLVMTQDSPHTNYKLWAVCPLFQNATMPAFSVDGSQLGGADDSGLVQTPKDALAHYADVLQNKDSSQYASEFEDDQLRQSVTSVAAKIQQTFNSSGVTFSQDEVFSPDDAQIEVMRTADGGDLVVGRINSVWTRRLDSNRQALPASDAERALFGGATATSTIQVTYVNTVALYVPAADSGQQMRAVGAQRQPIQVAAV